MSAEWVKSVERRTHLDRLPGARALVRHHRVCLCNASNVSERDREPVQAYRHIERCGGRV